MKIRSNLKLLFLVIIFLTSKIASENQQALPSMPIAPITTISSTATNNNKVIYMVSPPRSLTSAFARMMQARGDFSIYDEPSVLAFNLKHVSKRGTFFLDWFKEGAPKTYDEFKSIIFNDLKTKNVFLKEMTFSVREFLTQDLEFVKDPRVHFVFLIRNPHDALISVYRKLPITQANLGLALPVVSYEPCYEIYEHLLKHAVHKPYVLLTEDLHTNTTTTVKDFCTAMHIPFIESSLTWQNLGDTFDGSSWHEYKKADQMYHWHDNAIRSTGFHKPAVYTRDTQGLPTFQEIKEPDGRVLCMHIYKENTKFYKKFLQAADEQKKSTSAPLANKNAAV